MATVTGFTADRMKQIEDSTVVGGHVDSNGNLILQTRDGNYIIGGHVGGTPGKDGSNGKDGVADPAVIDDIYDKIRNNEDGLTDLGITPKRPENLILLSNTAEFLENGLVETQVYIMWDEVIKSTDEKPIIIAEYEVWFRFDEISMTPYRRTPDAELVMRGLEPNKTHYISVRARAKGSTVWSVLSEEIAVIPGLPEFVDIPPSAPHLESSLGVVFPFWDGLLSEGTVPFGFLHLITEHSSSNSTNDDDWIQMGITTSKKGQTGQIPSTVGSILHVRFRWSDTLGRTSSPSEVSMIEVSGIKKVDLDSVVSDAIEQARADSAAALASVMDTVKSITIEYSVATSDTVAPTTGWSSATPARTPGSFIWTRTVVTYLDETTEVSSPAVMTGNSGLSGSNGVGIRSTLTTYQVGNSGTVAPTGTWVASPQVPGDSQYLWTRTVITMTDDSTSTAYSVSSKGSAGAAGSPGAPGTGVSSVNPYFLLVGSGSNAPAKPTTNPPGGSWSLMEPAYVSSTELYRTDLVVYTNGSFAYSAVTKVSSYTAATQAVVVANLADAKAQGMVKASVTDPGHQLGRIWLILNGAGEIIGIKISNGAAWASYLIMADQILVPSSVGTVSIKDNAITAGKIIIGDYTNVASGSHFEGTENPWDLSASSINIDSAQAYSGTKSLKMSALASTQSARLMTSVNTKPDEEWYIEMWAYRDAAYNGTGGNSKLRISNGAGDALLGALAYTPASIPVANQWTKLTYVFKVPAGVTSLNVRLMSDNTAGTLWLDDIVFRRRAAGELIVDGAITGKKLQADEVWADQAWLNALRVGIIETSMVTPDFGDTLNLVSNGQINAIIETQVTITEDVANARDTADGAASAAEQASNDAGNALATGKKAQNKANQVDADQKDTAAKVTTISLWFRVDANGAHIGQTGSPFQTHMKPDRFEITDNNVVTTYWESGQMVVPSAAIGVIELSNHKLEPYGLGTIIRSIGILNINMGG